MIRQINNKDKILAYIITSDHTEDGTNFITPGDFSQQLAFMRHEKGHVIPPHTHNPVHREVKYTLEVLFIKKGKVRVDFYESADVYLESTILQEGDTILLASGGHGFEALDDLEMIEVKQGPYAGDADKTRFSPVSVDQLNHKLPHGPR